MKVFNPYTRNLGLLINISGWFGVALMQLVHDGGLSGYMIAFAAIVFGGMFFVAGANNGG